MLKVSEQHFKSVIKSKVLIPGSFKEPLPQSLLIKEEQGLAVFYAPFRSLGGERHELTKVIIIGITPGLSQAWKAIEAYKLDLSVREKAAFAGPMRSRLVSWLDEIGLAKAIDIRTCQDLFNVRKELLAVGSLIRFPTFYKSKNYTGSFPKIISNQMLKPYVEETCSDIAKTFGRDCLVIPLGKIVEQSLKMNFQDHEITILEGLPHPSLINSHGAKQFLDRKDSLKEQIKLWPKACGGKV